MYIIYNIEIWRVSRQVLKIIAGSNICNCSCLDQGAPILCGARRLWDSRARTFTIEEAGWQEGAFGSGPATCPEPEQYCSLTDAKSPSVGTVGSRSSCRMSYLGLWAAGSEAVQGGRGERGRQGCEMLWTWVGSITGPLNAFEGGCRKWEGKGWEVARAWKG